MPKKATVIPLELTEPAALRMVRQLAGDSDRIVVIKPHGTDAMKKRKVTRMQVERCLQKGTISEGRS